MRLAACTLAMLVGVACKEDEAPLPPPGEGPGVGATVTASATGGGDGGSGASTSASAGQGGVPRPETPANCGCMASAGAEACRECLDASADGSCADAASACAELGERYCALVFDCIALCPEPDVHCVDTCLGAHDSARETVEAFVACACDGCGDACGDASCE